ncbi:MAG: rhomboid family intramembrane serine protease [Chloroflexota bacterium]|nr:rhomboid family intramembrane serine protease [Chloroflexota bacterium]
MLPIGDENEPGYGPAVVTIAFIAINIFVFLALQGAGADADFTYSFSAVPLEITHGVDLVGPEVVSAGGQEFLIPQGPGPDPIYLTLLTSMFMHGGWLHLGGNMLFLFIFGDNVEHFVGAVVYALFYLAAGIVASVAQILTDANSVIPSLGASGAISGVLGAYLVLFPGNRVTVIIFRFPAQVPALVAIGMWAVFQFINGLGAFAVSEQTTGGVAYMAHIGGFAAGLVAGLLFRGVYGSPAARRSRLSSG